jgi:hypothetical protein
MSGQIFISYRREDASYPAGRLYDNLHSHFPENEIFMDVDSIKPGIDFIKTIEERVGACEVLVAVIGKSWLSAHYRRFWRVIARFTIAQVPSGVDSLCGFLSLAVIAFS